MKILEAEQLSSEWFQAHCGIVSGSHMGNVLDFSKLRTLKSGEQRGGLPGKKRITYQRTKLAELLTGIAIQENYVSREMLDGIEREPAGRQAYEREEDVMVQEVGFCLSERILRLGVSPDGLIDHPKDGRGGVELKCPKAGTHLAWILAGEIPEEHLPQVDTCIAVAEVEWWDFSSFCPLIAEKKLQLATWRRYRDTAAVTRIEAETSLFNEQLDALVDRLRAIVGPFDLPAAQGVKFERPGPDPDLSEEQESELGLSDEDIQWAMDGFPSEEN
jgi:hypothetical protein